MSTGKSAFDADAQMLWKSLRRQPDGMTEMDLTNLWSPTWSRKQVQTMLDHLTEAGLVQSTRRHQLLYRACDPSVGSTQGGLAS